MKFLKIIPFFALFYFTANSLPAQWHKLPAPAIPNTWIYFPPECPRGSTLPDGIIYPAANGVIVYNFQCNVGSSGIYAILVSRNDLKNDSVIYTYDAIQCCISPYINSLNDSTFAFIINFGTIYFYYTSSSFSTLENINAIMGVLGGPPAITPKFIYLASQEPGLLNDSLIFDKTTISNNSCSYSSSYGDSGIGKFSFINDSTGFLETYYRGKPATNLLIKTTDFGKTWNPIYYDIMNNVTDFCFPTKDTGYIVISNDSVFKTTNGGAVWNKVSVPKGNFTCIQFANSQVGYIGGTAGFLIKTTNGGLNWAIDSTGDTNSLKALYTFGASVAYFTDFSLNIYKNQPLSDSPPEKEVETLNLIFFPNPNNGNFIISLPNSQQPVTLEIYNALGQKIYTSNITTGDNYISLPYKQDGLYLYRMINNNGSLISKGKFIVM